MVNEKNRENMWKSKVQSSHLFLEADNNSLTFNPSEGEGICKNMTVQDSSYLGHAVPKENLLISDIIKPEISINKVCKFTEETSTNSNHGSLWEFKQGILGMFSIDLNTTSSNSDLFAAINEISGMRRLIADKVKDDAESKIYRDKYRKCRSELLKCNSKLEMTDRLLQNSELRIKELEGVPNSNLEIVSSGITRVENLNKSIGSILDRKRDKILHLEDEYEKLKKMFDHLKNLYSSHVCANDV